MHTIAQKPHKSAKDSTTDSLHLSYLPEITVVGQGSKSDYQQMPEIVGTNIYAGKKSALIVIDNVQGNIVKLLQLLRHVRWLQIYMV